MLGRWYRSFGVCSLLLLALSALVEASSSADLQGVHSSIKEYEAGQKVLIQALSQIQSEIAQMKQDSNAVQTTQEQEIARAETQIEHLTSMISDTNGIAHMSYSEGSLLGTLAQEVRQLVSKTANDLGEDGRLVQRFVQEVNTIIEEGEGTTKYVSVLAVAEKVAAARTKEVADSLSNTSKWSWFCVFLMGLEVVGAVLVVNLLDKRKKQKERQDLSMLFAPGLDKFDRFHLG